MKKYTIIIISLLFSSSIFCAEWQIYNNTKGKIYVVLQADSRPDYERELLPSETWKINTYSWCIVRIMLNGRDGDVAGLYAEKSTGGHECDNYTVEVTAKDLYVDPLYNVTRAHYLDIAML
ncbi:MAG: hypothetical protein WA432_04960 [Candidatus Babeliaceae bacterium]